MASVSNPFTIAGALGANYTSGRNAMTQSGGSAVGGTGGDWCSSFYTGTTWSNDHSSEITLASGSLVAVSTFPTTWVMVRMTNPGGASHETAYALGLKPNGTNVDVGLYRLIGTGANYNGTSIATLATNIAYVAGDRFKLQVVGSTLSAYQNGVQIGTNQTDTNIPSGGSPGFGQISTTAANGIDFWTGADVIGTGFAWAMPTSKAKPWGSVKPSVGYGIDWSDPINKSLISAWLFNENAGQKLYNLVSKRFNSTFNNSPVWSGGRFGRAVAFVAGSAQTITEPNLTFTLGQPITISLWINATSATGTANSAISFTGGGIDTPRIQAHIPYLDGNLYWDCGDSTNGRISTSYSGFSGKWTHVVLVNNGTNFKAIYLDGNLKNSGTTLSGRTDVMTGFVMGDYQGLGGHNYLTGSIDNVRVYNRALSNAEIRKLYTEPFAGIETPKFRMMGASITDSVWSFLKSKPWGQIKPSVGYQVNWGDSINKGLFGCWLMNEKAGQTLYDIAKKNHAPFTATLPTWSTGRFGSALSFGGVSGSAYVSAIKPTWNGQTIGSMSIWVNANSGISSGWAMSIPNSVSDQCFTIGIINATTLRYDAVNSGTNFTVSSITGAWHMLTVTYDGVTKRDYVDGILIHSEAKSGAFSTSTNELNFGRFSSNPFNPFPGLVDNARLYTRALASSEVMRLYTEPFAGIETPKMRIMGVQGSSSPVVAAVYRFFFGA